MFTAVSVQFSVLAAQGGEAAVTVLFYLGFVISGDSVSAVLRFGDLVFVRLIQMCQPADARLAETRRYWGNGNSVQEMWSEVKAA
jgi:hypothetical protein